MGGGTASHMIMIYRNSVIPFNAVYLSNHTQLEGGALALALFLPKAQRATAGKDQFGTGFTSPYLYFSVVAA